MNINKHVFQANPVSLDISRSRFDLSHGWKGTFNTGLAIPCLAYSDVLPGDTFKVKASCVIRSTTPVAPVMDNAFADVYFFFVPHKLTLSRKSMSPDVGDSNHSWEAFIGAQDNLLNMPVPSAVELPCFDFGNFNSGVEDDFVRGSLADYLGLPDLGVASTVAYGIRRMNCLEPLAYYKVWSDYFRDPNTMNPVTYAIANDTWADGLVHPTVKVYGGIGFTGLGHIGYADTVLPVCRFHGYFGSALPWPQRNSTQVELPLGDYAELGVVNTEYDLTGNGIGGSDGTASYNGSNVLTIDKTNIVADLSTATAASVNALRLAVQTQRWYEALARGGNRIDEMTASMFGVTPSDAGSSRAEYLGGKRIMINVQQVANTAGTNQSTTTQQAIGSTGAYSLTTDDDFYFTKSFDTWGTIIGIVCVRVAESFHQGLNRRHTRFDRMDFYWPQFANLGEQKIANSEIYFADDGNNDKVFGYQEAWAEYRFFPDTVTGLTRPGNNQAYWNYANHFTSRPNLAGYLNASSQVANVDRTLQVPSTTAGFQWLADFHFDISAVRPMPTYSIPGLVDHH